MFICKAQIDYIIASKYIAILAPTCRKEQVREYYSENGCRSRKPLKMAKCVGGCGSCCQARKSKRRKVICSF